MADPGDHVGPIPAITIGRRAQFWGGSATRRALLAQALASIGYAAWTADAEHATDGMRAVDLNLRAS